MFSLTKDICNKKPKGPILMELFTATGKMKKSFLRFPLIFSDHAENWPEPVQRHLQRLTLR